MGDNEPVPPYVSYSNAAANEVRAEVKESIEGLRTDVKGAVDLMMSKADGALLEFKLGVETKAREDADKQHDEQIAALVALRKADEAERKAKGRRIWGAVWALGGIVTTAAINQMIQIWNQTH